MDKPRKPQYAEACLLEEITELSMDGQESLEKLVEYTSELEDYVEFLQEEMDELERTDEIVDEPDDEYVTDLESQVERMQVELEYFRMLQQNFLQQQAENALYKAQLDAIRLVTR